MTSQSISVDVAPVPGQPRLALRLGGVDVWRWHAASRTRKPLLTNVTWDVRAGERWALLGPNGAGKTTLLTLAGAVEFPSAGTAEILGRTMGRTDVPGLRSEIGFVDARLGYRFEPRLTLREVVLTGATGTVGSFPERAVPTEAHHATELLDRLGLGPIAERRFYDCSQGERKRALIARALVARPRLLLLDEPGAGLDLPGREILLDVLAEAMDAEPALAVVVAAHHLEELPTSTTHALLLRHGAVVAAGPVAESLTSETLGRCFGIPITLSRTRGRFGATSP